MGGHRGQGEEGDCATRRRTTVEEIEEVKKVVEHVKQKQNAHGEQREMLRSQVQLQEMAKVQHERN